MKDIFIFSQKRTLGVGLAGSASSKKGRFSTPFKATTVFEKSETTPRKTALQNPPDKTDSHNHSINISSTALKCTHTPQPLRKRTLTRRNFTSPFIGSPKPAASVSSDRKLVNAKEELRRLKLVQYHRTHNDLSMMTDITKQWQEAGHKALHELHDNIETEPKPTALELLEILRIPQEHFSCDCDT